MQALENHIGHKIYLGTYLYIKLYIYKKHLSIVDSEGTIKRKLNPWDELGPLIESISWKDKNCLTMWVFTIYLIEIDSEV